MRALVIVVPVLAIALTACDRLREMQTVLSVSKDPPTEGQVDWTRANAIPFATDTPGSGFEDLEPLRGLIGDARVVALGEGTHGTREFFRLKHRLAEFLANEMGFTVFAIEANLPDAYALGDWVAGGPGDPDLLVRAMGFWIWNTDEIVELAQWMRQFNESGAGEMRFTGFDMKFPQSAIGAVRRYLAQVDAAAETKVAGVYQHLMAGRDPDGFSVVRWELPPGEIAGREIRYRGWIRTEEVETGFAGLWFRADSPEQHAIAFDNMQTRAPTGTTGWAEYEIVLQIPEGINGVHFGLIKTGDGRAWFDDLSVEIDGEPWAAAPAEQFGGEQGLPSVARWTEIDPTGARTGAASFRLAQAEKLPAAEAEAAAHGVITALEEKRAEYIEASDESSYEYAHRCARVVEQQVAREPEDYWARDRAMAENLLWILETNPGARVVVWAHNGHVHRDETMMGGILAKELGADYLPIAFATGAGEYRAIEPSVGLGVHPLQAPPPASVEAFLTGTDLPRLVLDLRRSEEGSALSGWARESRLFRAIGAYAMEHQFSPIVPAQRYDAIVWFAESEPSRPLGPVR